MSQDAVKPTLVVSLGTDHHKFDRLVDWVDEWLGSLPDPPPCLVQHGASHKPAHALARDRMPREDLLQLYDRALVVVVQGGPGSILDARAVGHVPIAVPRRPELHEVVDGHQIAFTKTMSEKGEAISAQSQEQLFRALERAFENPESMRTVPRISHPELAGANLEAAIGHLPLSRHPMAVHRTLQLLSRHHS